jgi:hypothetical protein
LKRKEKEDLIFIKCKIKWISSTQESEAGRLNVEGQPGSPEFFTGLL